VPSDPIGAQIAVFDLGGTWFRWGRYAGSEGLVEPRRVPAISYLSHPALSAAELQDALAEFIVHRVEEMRCDGVCEIRFVSVSLGAPVNAHDETVLGSGPLWGPTAGPFHLQVRLRERLPGLRWHVLNDITALLAPYMDDDASLRKTMLITVSSGIGSRLYDHRSRRIPYDATYGVQGEIGHLVFAFELDGVAIRRQCECGGWNHMNAFASGRGIAQVLRDLPLLSSRYGVVFSDSPNVWRRASDEYRLSEFKTQLEMKNGAATELLEAFVTPLSRALAAALSLDPEIDRIVITGGVAHGLGAHYRESLQRTFLRDGLYQITERDPLYLSRRLHWQVADDFAGLRGAGVYMERHLNMPMPGRPGCVIESDIPTPTPLECGRN
jgi:2-epi-5-epi-valiolone 7-kinase